MTNKHLPMKVLVGKFGRPRGLKKEVSSHHVDSGLCTASQIPRILPVAFQYELFNGGWKVQGGRVLTYKRVGVANKRGPEMRFGHLRGWLSRLVHSYWHFGKPAQFAQSDKPTLTDLPNGHDSKFSFTVLSTLEELVF